LSTYPASVESLTRNIYFSAAAGTLQGSGAEETNTQTAPEYAFPDIEQLLAQLPLYTSDMSYGPDIDAANTLLLDPKISSAAKEQHFRKWLSSRFQPCMLGRLGAKDHQGISFDICWIERATLLRGSPHVRSVLQAARRKWKARAKEGLTHGLLIMFNVPELAFARPGVRFMQACRKLMDLYLVEHAPVEPDVIYTEAVPLALKSQELTLFKATVNLFYTGAHRTRVHDRRVPGGLMISVISVGQLANSLVSRGIDETLQQAVAKVKDLALRSIGNGGMGHEGAQSTTWHNLDKPWDPGSCPIAHHPHNVPENFSARRYSAFYHTDALIPAAATADERLDPRRDEVEVWTDLRIDYFHVEPLDSDVHDYGMFGGHPIRSEAMYHNPWPPLRVVNSPQADY
jgi:hypothetical protein